MVWLWFVIFCFISFVLHFTDLWCRSEDNCRFCLLHHYYYDEEEKFSKSPLCGNTADALQSALLTPLVFGQFGGPGRIPCPVGIEGRLERGNWRFIQVSFWICFCLICHPFTLEYFSYAFTFTWQQDIQIYRHTDICNFTVYRPLNSITSVIWRTQRWDTLNLSDFSIELDIFPVETGKFWQYCDLIFPIISVPFGCLFGLFCRYQPYLFQNSLTSVSEIVFFRSFFCPI